MRSRKRRAFPRRLEALPGLLLALAPLASPAADAGLGQAIYANCASCHGAAGEGGRGPPLASDRNLANTPYVVSHILTGSSDMPPFRDQLSQDEVAAVTNYIRSRWGNRAPAISAGDVATVRNALGLSDRPH